MQKILISDDHSIIRRGLKFILSTHFENFIIDELHSIKDTLDYLKTTTPDFAIFDLQLSDGNMLEALPNIIALYPRLDILIYSMSSEDIYAKRILQLGAKGFLNKDADELEVIRALQLFLSGQNYISYRLNNLLMNDLLKHKNKNNENIFADLSNREIEVAHHLLEGKSIKEISGQMNLHANTVITYKNRVFEKLSINNLVELASLANLYNFK